MKSTIAILATLAAFVISSGCLDEGDDDVEVETTAKPAICAAITPCLTTPPYCGLTDEGWSELHNMYQHYNCY